MSIPRDLSPSVEREDKDEPSHISLSSTSAERISKAEYEEALKLTKNFEEQKRNDLKAKALKSEQEIERRAVKSQTFI